MRGIPRAHARVAGAATIEFIKKRALRRLVEWRFHRRSLAVLFIDLFLCGISLPAALTIRIGDLRLPYNQIYLDGLALGVPLLVIVGALVFYFCDLYRVLWRYVSVHDIVSIAKSAALAVAIFTLLMFLVNRLATLPRSVPIIQFLLLVTLMSGTRVIYKQLLRRAYLRRGGDPFRVPAILVGVNANSDLFIRATENDPHAPFTVVAVLDTNREHVGRTVHKVPVLGTVGDLEDVVKHLERLRRRPQRVLVSESNESFDVAALRESAERLGMGVAHLPSFTSFRTSPTDTAPAQVSPQDLLRRPTVVLSRAEPASLVADRRVLVTGAGGSIGSELCLQVAACQPAEIVLLENSEFNLYSIDHLLGERFPEILRRPILCDIRQRADVMRVFRECMPDIIFHAAALKHIPLAEANPIEAFLTNVVGARNIADAALESRSLGVVQISTDKAVRPSSIMGATKCLAEYYAQALDLDGRGAGADACAASTRFVTVRFGNVLGSSGSVVELFQRQLAKGGPLTITHPDMKRYFMTVGEATALVLQASAYGIASLRERGRILVLDMGRPIRILDIAHQMIHLAGYRPDTDIRIEFTGLRPGEKLEEELFDPTADLVETDVPGVLSAPPTIVPLAEIQAIFDELVQIASRGDVAEMRRRIARLIPDCGFSGDSPYQAGLATSTGVARR